MRTEKRDLLDRIERLLRREIRLGDGKELLAYDPDSPFSYITAFLRDRSVASVHPSSRFLVDRVLRAMAPEKARTVVEYGAAEGVITRRILARMPADGVLVAVELNDHFIQALRKMRDPRLRIVHGDVQDIEGILRGQGLDFADVVVSGIPFSYFDKERRRTLLRRTYQRLRPGGRFVAYQFTTHLIPLLKHQFRKVDTQFEVRNLPPHFVFTAFK